jgi:hypothetical protein
MSMANNAMNLLFSLLLLPLFFLLLGVQAQYFPYSFSLQRKKLLRIPRNGN